MPVKGSRSEVWFEVCWLPVAEWPPAKFRLPVGSPPTLPVPRHGFIGGLAPLSPPHRPLGLLLPSLQLLPVTSWFPPIASPAQARRNGPAGRANLLAHPGSLQPAIEVRYPA